MEHILNIQILTRQESLSRPKTKNKQKYILKERLRMTQQRKCNLILHQNQMTIRHWKCCICQYLSHFDE